MFGNREVPIANTNAVGTAWVRITADNNVYSNINVVNLAAGETLTAAHIHTGAIGANGPVLVNILPNGVTDFGRTVKIPITQLQASGLTSNPLYLNAHSTRFPGGVVRGQVRN
ncbi:MAG: CHRD domain-containing protein [Bacteroidetes bacterium]|nr:MAG: CHRD domain-containing protein [Bacteroidota bacterium]